ncbi:MFS transporter [Thermodesulfobacteriota bacterium]
METLKEKSGRFIGNLKTFDSLKRSDFRFYFFGMLGNMFAINMQMIVRSLLLYRLTRSAMVLGLVALFHALPMVFLSLFGGVIADRLSKKHVLIVGHIFLAIVALVIALSLDFGWMSAENQGSWKIIIVASVFQGVIVGLVMPSRQSIIPELVGGERLMNAVALNMFGMNIARIMAPAIAGFIVDVTGFAAIYYIMTGLYIIAGVLFMWLPRLNIQTTETKTVLSDLISGLQYARRDKTILLLLVFALIAICLSMHYMFLMPIFTDDILKVGATGMGTLMSLSGIGAIISSIILASLPNKKRGVMLLFTSMLMGFSLIGFSCSSSYFPAMVMIVFVGMGQAGRATLANTLLQYYVADEYRGRVMSIYITEFGLRSIGVFLAGLLAEKIGVQWSVGGSAFILVLISLGVWVFVPRLKNLD